MFRFDGPFMQKLNQLSGILYVHILAFIACIPVITAGASFTALEYALLKIYREEDSDLTKTFFAAFVQNFKQATVLWFIYLLCGFFVVSDIVLLSQVDTDINDFLMLGICMVSLLLVLNMTWGFMLLSRYCNSALQTFKYAFPVSLIYIARTIPMLLMTMVPIVLTLWYIAYAPYIFVIGTLLSGYVRPRLCIKVLDGIESREKQMDTASKMTPREPGM